jgi:hypothetical protein
MTPVLDPTPRAGWLRRFGESVFSDWDVLSVALLAFFGFGAAVVEEVNWAEAIFTGVALLACVAYAIARWKDRRARTVIRSGNPFTSSERAK